MRVDNQSANDIRETAGLVLNVAAVIGFVLSLNSFGTGSPGAAALVGTAAAAAFMASLVCFAGEQPAEDQHAGAVSTAHAAPPAGEGFDPGISAA